MSCSEYRYADRLENCAHRHPAGWLAFFLVSYYLIRLISLSGSLKVVSGFSTPKFDCVYSENRFLKMLDEVACRVPNFSYGIHEAASTDILVSYANAGVPPKLNQCSSLRYQVTAYDRSHKVDTCNRDIATKAITAYASSCAARIKVWSTRW